MIECMKCGAEFDANRAFCPQCSGLNARSGSILERASSALAGRVSASSKRLASLPNDFRRTESRKQIIGGAILLVVLLIAFTANPISNGIGAIFAGNPDGPQLTAEGLPDFASYEDVFVSEEAD